MLSFDILTLYRIITHYSSTQHRWAMWMAATRW
jgi:hypothetical protein